MTRPSVSRLSRFFLVTTIAIGLSGLAALDALAIPPAPSNSTQAQDEPRRLSIGSKSFTESVVLGEIAAQLAKHAGATVERRFQMGGTRILWNALLSGDIDMYPEYTGTLMQEIFAGRGVTDSTRLKELLEAYKVRMSKPLGFNNTYALGMLESTAEKLNITAISDLNRHPYLSFGFSNEFMDRADGWPGLQTRYQLPHKTVRGLSHDLAYRGLASGDLQVMDLYATDAEIRFYQIRTLRDDRQFFPTYNAVWLYRAELEQSDPAVIAGWKQLEGRINDARMVALNARAKLDRVPEPEVAADYLSETLSLAANTHSDSAWQRIARHTREHLFLVLLSLSAAILIGIPIGILAARRARLGHALLAATSAVQTIPSLAMFVFLIPWLGIGDAPALVALFLYSLLPIVRNTHAGLQDLPGPLLESADALGLPPATRLRRIELPLASRTILAGIKTAAVWNVGVATLAPLIGAGGYGQPILTGIRLADVGLTLQGAVPAVLMALAIQGLFELAERYTTPKGLRINAKP